MDLLCTARVSVGESPCATIVALHGFLEAALDTCSVDRRAPVLLGFGQGGVMAREIRPEALRDPVDRMETKVLQPIQLA